MNKKKVFAITSIACVLLSIVISAVLFIPQSNADRKVDESFSKKVVNNAEKIDLKKLEKDEYLGFSVILWFSDEFLGERRDYVFTDRADLTAHRNEIFRLCTENNEKWVDKFDLKNYKSVSYRYGAPLIIYSYESYEAFMESDFYLIQAQNSDELLGVTLEHEFKGRYVTGDMKQ